MKRCSKCGETKDYSKFYKGRGMKDGRLNSCKTCCSLYGKKYCLENKEKNRDKYKEWYQKNKEKHKIQCKEWHSGHLEHNRKYRKENREHIRKYFCEYKRKNPQIRLYANVGSQMSRMLKKRKGGRKWNFLVGYTVQNLIHHLEKQFDNKMNWQNYGKYWHIDHIKPQSWFKYETAEDEEFRKCWALENLQPLEAKANWSKNNRFISQTF